MTTGDGEFRQTMAQLNAIVSKRKPNLPPSTRQHPTHRFLAISKNAQVWRYSSEWDRWRIIHIKIRKQTHYTYVNVKIGGRSIQFGLATLVLQSWVGPRPLGFEPLHFPDKSPSNCYLENLRWAPRGTHLVGHDRGDRARFGKVYRGSDTGNHILEESDISEIDELHRHGFHCDEIGERFFVSESTIKDAVTRRTWKHVDKPIDNVSTRRREISSGERSGDDQ